MGKAVCVLRCSSSWYRTAKHHITRQLTTSSYATARHSTHTIHGVAANNVPPYKIDFWLNINNLSCFCRFVASVFGSIVRFHRLVEHCILTCFVGEWASVLECLPSSVENNWCMWFNVKRKSRIRLLCIAPWSMHLHSRSTNSKIEVAKIPTDLLCHFFFHFPKQSNTSIFQRGRICDTSTFIIQTVREQSTEQTFLSNNSNSMFIANAELFTSKHTWASPARLVRVSPFCCTRRWVKLYKNNIIKSNWFQKSTKHFYFT